MKTLVIVLVGLAVAVALTWQARQISSIQLEIVTLQAQVSALDEAQKRARALTTTPEGSKPQMPSSKGTTEPFRSARPANSMRSTPHPSDVSTSHETTTSPSIDQVGLERQAEHITQLEEQIQDMKVALEQLMAAAAAVPDQPEWVEKQRQAGEDEISNLEHKLERLRDAQRRGVVLREY
jgi:hypothetical protein